MALFQSIFKTTHQGKASKCGVCGTQFKQNLMVLTNVVTHKCKRCNLYICINCGPENKKMKIHGYKDTKLHRVCTFCQNDKKYVNQYLIEPNLQSWIPNIPINIVRNVLKFILK
ncbi:Zinc finger, FYVE/PHD-type [Pseudocohnilembus persalinus]|uniref:Zinc finger, FYVE/PHD-type n=1 Tax=Pseudocohnilembus persalinus TaxID=266149 RepID=A0A0V0QIQ7_PSEPJ|nr:Zinc finger, FYVE/PHD-type [Pseudocohnilembus persalinus]|eukprot:KRX02105.1 Zinc finger, FYVE/PHD-type [Pseudocohnilembus persalinus]